MTPEQEKNLAKLIEDGVLTPADVAAIQAADEKHRKSLEPDSDSGAVPQ